MAPVVKTQCSRRLRSLMPRSIPLFTHDATALEAIAERAASQPIPKGSQPVKTSRQPKSRTNTRRVGDTGGESDDPSVVAAAFAQAAAAAAGQETATGQGGQDEGSPPPIVVKRRGSDDGDDGNAGGSNEALMRLLPSACRQGVLCRVSVPLRDGGGGGVGGEDIAVLLGSTLAGAGVFSGLDGAWFGRVCAYLSLGAAVTGAATAEAGGR